MNTNENTIHWQDEQTVIDCPKCAEIIGTAALSEDGKFLRTPRLRFLKVAQPEQIPATKEQPARWKYVFSGKCVTCNAPTSLYYFTNELEPKRIFPR